MSVTLEPMAADRFLQWREREILEYARDKVEAGVWPEDGAVAASAAEIASLLPDGPDTPGHDIFVGVVDGAEVGQVWLFTDPEAQVRETFVYEISIDEQHRGKGLGRGLLDAAESWCGDHGVTVVRLNVFAFNTTAISLYESSGFTATNLNMMKRIGAP
jgi:ribosomal protein S18 acetylase RimI-like enzyme